MAKKVLMKGNETIAEAAIMAGCRHYFGYPITPQTEVAAYMAKRMPKSAVCFCKQKVKLLPSIWSSVWLPPASAL